MPIYKLHYSLYKLTKGRRNDLNISDLSDALEYLKQDSGDTVSYSDLESELYFALSHHCDTSELVIKFDPEHNDFPEILKFLNALKATQDKPNSKYFRPMDETNLHLYGKISIDISQINIPEYNGNIFAIINLEPYRYHTKSVINSGVFSIKQSFYLPVHNRFEQLKIEIYSKSHSGFIHKKTVDEKLCEYSILLPDVLNNDFPNKTLEVEIENCNKSIKATKVSVMFKIRNLSNILALLDRNRNKNIIEDLSLLKSDENFGIKMLLKRMKKIVVLVKDVKEYYKTLFRWKYPVFSGLSCFCLLTYFIFCDVTYALTHLVCFMLYTIFINSRIFSIYLTPYSEKYIYSIRNPYDFDSAITTKVENEADEVKRDDYLFDDNKKKTNVMNYIIEPIKTYKNIKASYNKALFTFTKFVSSIEKIKNLFLWTDPLLTFYFFILLILVSLAIYSIKVKYIMIMVIVKKFLSGMLYYKRKYRNNTEVARIILANSYFNYIDNSKRKNTLETSRNTEDIDLYTIGVNDDKFRTFIKEQLEQHGDLMIQLEFLKSVKTLGEIGDAIAKSKALLKLKKDSSYYKFTIDNANIYKVPLDIDLIFFYFVQNVKSDYYISKYYKQREARDLDENLTIKHSTSSEHVTRKEK
jgi:hypothetical protein